ncbi:hypothetical protein [Limisalsivibrio acetivorans]|uniref:hypothetical protein n=1 Tax=Limisalsivibrio acetivorans TaxID=1304888 RepID=UPI0003B5435B|nr:hypothetical protein [Limisalsivibrio acetivorans]
MNTRYNIKCSRVYFMADGSVAATPFFKALNTSVDKLYIGMDKVYGLQLMEDGYIDMMLLDISIENNDAPEVDSFIGAVKSRSGDFPVIVISEPGDVADNIVEADFVMVKPVIGDSIFQVLDICANC